MGPVDIVTAGGKAQHQLVQQVDVLNATFSIEDSSMIVYTPTSAYYGELFLRSSYRSRGTERLLRISYEYLQASLGRICTATYEFSGAV